MEKLVAANRQDVLEFFHSHGMLISPTALDTIIKEGLGQFIPKMLSQEVLDLGYIDDSTIRKLMRGDIKTDRMDFEVNLPDIRINNSVEDFQQLFVSRYKKISRLISVSSSMRGSLDIRSAKKTRGEVKVIGIVYSVDTTRNGHKRIIIEDTEDSIAVMLLKNKGLDNELILQDEVIGVIGTTSSGSGDTVIFANEIVRPDIPYRVIDDNGKPPAYVASISDIHVGSKTFRKDDFKRAINWISRSEDEAKDLKYLILSGDVVDGIGVYPGQQDDLEIFNPLEQYSKLSEYLSEIPEDVTVFILPGNHDVVRLAEPQPKFSGKLKEILPKNAVLLPNPCNLRLEEKNVLIYHGMSLNDMVELIPGANFTTIGKAIEEMLKRRHLAIKYGGNTPLIPSANDYHVIEQVPDIFITGHIHSHYVGNYRGVRYVNSSTWQSQTDYQRMMNFAPNPSIMTLFDLNSKTTIIKNFDSTN